MSEFGVSAKKMGRAIKQKEAEAGRVWVDKKDCTDCATD
jgi:hypothetical protein